MFQPQISALWRERESILSVPVPTTLWLRSSETYREHSNILVSQGFSDLEAQEDSRHGCSLSASGEH